MILESPYYFIATFLEGRARQLITAPGVVVPELNTRRNGHVAIIGYSAI